MWILSNENVENVVNPPQSPVFKNNTAFSDIVYFIASFTTSPIINAPTKLIHNVIIGNVISKGN